jgi:hypothetical protein
MNLSTDGRLDFFDFIKNNSILFAQVLTKINNIYISEFSAGLDGQTICNSISTADFWHGIIPLKGKAYTFNQKDNSLNSFYQFFSNSLKDKIDSITVVRCRDDKIILFCNCKKLSEEINDVSCKLASREINCKGNKYQLDFTQAITSFILSKKLSEYEDALFTALSNALFYRLSRSFEDAALVSRISPALFTLACIEKEDIPFELLLSHLKLDCSYILDSNSQSLILKEA